MAFPLLGAITAGLGAVSQGINAITQRNADKRNIKFAREMYEKQKADNQKLWMQQNTYNSPQEQMKRLQAAGLNPNLVYGSGQAITEASPVPQAEVPKGQYHATQVDLGSIAQGYFNVQLQKQQLDNAKLLNDKLRQDIVIDYYESGLSERDQGEVESIYNKQTGDIEVRPKKFVSRKYELLGHKIEGQKIQNEIQRINQYIADKGKDLKIEDLARSIALKAAQKGQIKASTELIDQKIALAVQEGSLKQFDLDAMEAINTGQFATGRALELIKVIISLFNNKRR